MSRRADRRSLADDLTPFVRGAVQLVVRQDGLYQPVRFYRKQMDVLAEKGREKRARATSGVIIDFMTDSDQVAFDCAVTRPLEHSHPIYMEVMERAGELGVGEDGIVDGIDLVVSDACAYTTEVRDGRIVIDFDNPDHSRLEVKIYLPTIMSVAIGNLSTTGSLEKAPDRDYMLALGDSITQGFVVGCPSLTWPALVASGAGLDLLNQGIAGYVFDKATLRGMAPLREYPPKLITVAYGTNDWSRKDSAKAIERDAREYIEKLVWRFPGVPVFVLSPVWRADAAEPMPSGKSLSWMTSMIEGICSEFAGVTFVNGLALMPHTPTMLADDRLHPGSVGASIVADGMLAAIDEKGLISSDAPAKRSMAWARGFVDTTGLDESAAEEIDVPLVTKRVSVATGMPEGPASDADKETLARVGSPQTHPAFDALVRTIWRLRQPDGCPWDKVQTHDSIERNMLEEAYEAVGAIDEGDPYHLREELGDVLMQVLLHAQIADDDGSFDIDDICRVLDEKLVRRHPHVFGRRAEAQTAEEVTGIWSNVKIQERRDAEEASQDADEEIGGILDDVPRAMPALMQCQKVSKRAAACGFEWPSVDEIWDKVDEERAEYLSEQPGTAEAEMEFGDLLFALVNVARRQHIDAEEALRKSCEKFRTRWATMEAQAKEAGADLSAYTPEQFDEAWGHAKEKERQNLL